MGTYTKNLKLETPSYTDNADIPALTKKNNEIIDSEMIKRANGLNYNEQTGVLQLTGNNSKVGSPIQIKNNLPVTSMSSGTELKVNNYKQLIKFSLEGKTEQKTSKQGKNLIGLKKGFTQTVNGMTVSVQDDGGLRVTGTPTKISESYIPLEVASSISNGDYTLSVKTIGSTPSNACRLLKTNLASAANSFKSTALSCQSNTTKSMSATITDEEVYTYFYFYTNANVSIDATIYPQLEKGSTYTEWGEFTPDSPSPDYPQDIENISGIENLLNIPDGTYTNNGITAVVKDGVVTLNGTATDISFINMLVSLTLKNTNYTLSANNEKTIGNSLLSSDYGCVRLETTGQAFSNRNQIATFENKNSSVTYNWNSKIAKCVIRTSKGITYDNFVIKPMLEEGAISHDFVLPKSNYLQLKNESKNKFNIIDYSEIKAVSNDYASIVKSASKISIKTNKSYSYSGFYIAKENVQSYIDDVDLSKQYTISMDVNISADASIKFGFNENAPFKTYSKGLYRLSFTNTLTSSFVIYVNKVSTDIEITNIMISLSDDISYEPYQKKIISIDLKGNNLCSNKDKAIKDELVIENGKAKINKKFGEYIFTGNETFSFADKGARIMSNTGRISQLKNVYIPTPQSSSNITPSFCTHYTVDGQGNVVKGSNKFGFSQYDNAKFIYFPADYSTIDEFKAKLKSLYEAGTPVRIQYPLAEPEVIDLGEVDFDLIENSTLTCEEESDMQIDYLTIDSNIFVQNSLDGSSSQKAPSINAVNKAINKISNYSSEEQCIGEWFGEKHYRKVFEIDMDSTLKQMTIPTGIDMKQLTHAYGVALNSDTIYLPLNFYNNLGWDSFHLTGKGENIILQRGDNFSITKVFITLEYTKNV